MRSGEKKNSGRGEGFKYYELAFLLVLVGALLAGMILLMWSAVDSLKPVKGEQRLSQEAERLMGRIRALSGGGWLSGDAAGIKQGPHQRLTFLVDVDGNGRTGDFHAGRERGLEKVIISRPDGDGGRLLARVYTARGGPPREVVLTDHLDRADPRAFYAGSPRRLADNKVRVEVSLRLRSRSRSFCIKGDITLP